MSRLRQFGGLRVNTFRLGAIASINSINCAGYQAANKCRSILMSIGLVIW
jgi:hypothetical protein